MIWIGTRRRRAAKLALAALLLGGGVITAPSAQAAFPGAPGLLAFSRGGNIWTMRSDGTGQRVLAPGTGLPQWSPDGSRIVFTRFVTAPDAAYSAARVFVMNADGSNVIQVTDGSQFPGDPRFWDAMPSWSPDGGSLVLVRGLDLDDHGSDLWTLRLSDGKSRRITHNAGWLELYPSWSPDGSRIVYVTDTAAQGDPVFVPGMAPPGGLDPGETGQIDLGPTFADQSMRMPDWSPDGSRLMVSSQPTQSEGLTSNIWTVGPDGSDPRQITHLGPGFRDFASAASWSPDGRRIVLTCTFYCDSLQGRGTYIADADGSNIHKIIDDLVIADWQPLPATRPCTIKGTPGPDVLTGTADDDVICGLGDDDTINGGGGADVIRGGAGNDTLRGGAGNDTIEGGNGADVVRGDAGNDTLRGGAGDDTLIGSEGSDACKGGGGVDHLVACEER